MVKPLKKSIGLLGGSFDPAHRGHLIISKIALKKIKLDKIFWVVTKKNPFKTNPFYSLQTRMEKAIKISKGIKKIKVVHFDKTVKSVRTINIINYLINTRKQENIYLIIGADNLIGFHKWKSWKKIVKISKLIVFSRKGYDRRSKKSIVAKYLKNKLIFIKNKPINISSTTIKKVSKKNI
jgi:nicotinate-nucleotide adenylyltransferase